MGIMRISQQGYMFHLDMERIGIVPKRAPAKIIDFRAHIENKHTID